jgi:chromosome segregation ATPase
MGHARLAQFVNQVIDENPRISRMDQDIAELKYDVRILKEDVRILKEDVRILKEDVRILKEDNIWIKDQILKLGVGQEQLRSNMSFLMEVVLDIRASLQKQKDHSAEIEGHSVRIKALERSVENHVRDPDAHK